MVSKRKNKNSPFLIFKKCFQIRSPQGSLKSQLTRPYWILRKLALVLWPYKSNRKNTDNCSESYLHFFHFYLGKSGYVQSKYCTYAAVRCFGSGQIVNVRFYPAFKNAPKVVIGLTLVDTHKDHNVRIRATAESVTRTGFKIRFKPWDTSITYRIGVNWMACPWTWRAREGWLNKMYFCS
jgi:hypothetical protein